MAFLHVTKAPEIGTIVRDKILPIALERFRNNIDTLTKGGTKILAKSLTASGTAFEASARFPISFDDFEEAFDDSLPLQVTGPLRRAFGLIDAAASTPLSAQFLIEGVDGWMQGLPAEERQRLVLACGVSPAAIIDGLSVNGFAPIDFVIDVMFPEGSVVWSTPVEACVPEVVSPANVLDWVAEVYDASDRNSGDAAASSFFATNREERQKWAAQEATSLEATVSEDDVQPNRGELEKEQCSPPGVQEEEGPLLPPKEEILDEFLTEDNLDAFMKRDPSLIPKRVLIARRKPILHPDIAAFELERHYTLSELRVEVQRVVDELKRCRLGNDVPEIDWKGKKSDIASSVHAALPVLRVLAARIPPHVVDVDADESSSSVVGNEHDANAGVAEWIHNYRTNSDGEVTPKVLVKALVDRFSRAQMEAYLVSPSGSRMQQDAVRKLKTKLDCAKRILSDCGGSS